MAKLASNGRSPRRFAFRGLGSDSRIAGLGRGADARPHHRGHHRADGWRVDGRGGPADLARRGRASGCWTPDGVYPQTPGFGTCVSDADGDCSFVVPQVGGENRDARFYVREIAAPTDYTPFIKVAGPAQVGGAGYASTVYAFETGPQLRAGSVYRSGQDFMADNTGEGFDGSSWEYWPSVRDDPAVQANCSLNLALLIDTSEGGEAQTAAESIADSPAQLPVPSTVSIYPFANSVPSNNNRSRPGLTVKPGDSSAADRAISTLRLQPSTSNWDNVLSTYAQASASDDLAILITGPIPTASESNPTHAGNAGAGHRALADARERRLLRQRGQGRWNPDHRGHARWK